MSTEEQELATRIINEMYNNDAFSQWLGIERLEEGPGYSKLRMTVREEMCNGFRIAHGGISYSFSDSAFAFACNSRGRKSVSVETSISHLVAIKPGDVLIAEAKEKSLSNRIGVYIVTVKNQEEKVVALFKGTNYRTSKYWFAEE